MKRKRLQWFGYIMWMEEDRKPKGAIKEEEKGKGPLKRQRTRWENQVKKDRGGKGTDWRRIEEEIMEKSRGMEEYLLDNPQ